MVPARRSTTESPSWRCFSGAEPPQIPIDSNGNLNTKTEGSDTWAYEWNARNELTRVTKNSIEQARFSYDPLGRRVEKVAGGVTSTYTYESGDILREIRGATALSYVHGPRTDEPLASDDGSGLTYYHADGLGSISKRTSQNGAVIHEYRYDAWGAVEIGASEPGYAFAGREWEPNLSLHFYRARYYDPSTGRFVSEDPITWAGGFNLYRAVENNPANLIDPFGLMSTVAWVHWFTEWMRGEPVPPPIPVTPDYTTVSCQIYLLSFSFSKTDWDYYMGGGGGFPKGCGCYVALGFLEGFGGKQETRDFLEGPAGNMHFYFGVGTGVTKSSSGGMAREYGMGFSYGAGGSANVRPRPLMERPVITVPDDCGCRE